MKLQDHVLWNLSYRFLKHSSPVFMLVADRASILDVSSFPHILGCTVTRQRPLHSFDLCRTGLSHPSRTRSCHFFRVSRGKIIKEEMRLMRRQLSVVLVSGFGFVSVVGNNVDLFNYDFRDDGIPGGTSFGQENWGSVTCDDLSVCVSTK